MKKKALVICFHPAFSPASSGGELRLLNLYSQLSHYIDITLLSSTNFGARFEKIDHTASFRELRFPKDELWRVAYQTLESAGVAGDLAGLAFALAVSDPACKLRHVARELALSADYVIHEFPFSEPIFSDGAAIGKEIYNSHNFEISLLASIVRGPGLDGVFLKLFRLERNLARRASLVFSTSGADQEKFRLFYGLDDGKLALCPNGYDEAEFTDVLKYRSQRVRADERPVLLFFGSDHHPNVEAGQSLVEMAAGLPHYHFVIAGGVCSGLKTLKIPANVELVGPFDQAQKLALLGSSDLFVNPVALGSGTSLKALEALGAGLPMVSTPEGARGLDLVDGEHATIVPREDVAKAIVALLGDRDAADRMALRGRDFAHGKFTWARVAAGLAAELASLGHRPAGDARPCVLAVNDYPALTADMGGKARLHGLLGNLLTDVILMSFADTYDIVLLGPGFLHVTVGKTPEHLSFQAAVNNGQKLSVDDCVASLFIATNRVFGEIACEIGVRSSAAILEHCYVAPIIDVLRTVRPDIPIVYSAHNVEAQHRVKMLEDHSLGGALSALVSDLEDRLVAQAQLVVCCTEEDAKYFLARGAETIVAPNGCDVPSPRALEELRKIAASPVDARRVGFMGSAHAPNVEAANFIVETVTPKFPHVVFEFLGGVCESMKKPLPPNVKLHGRVNGARKSAILASWTIALNPVISGGGSSLKLPDFMAHELATINTQSGARGFLVAEREAGSVASRSRFNDHLARLLAEPELLRRQRENAYRYASEQLSWTAATALYRERVRAFAQLGAPISKRGSLLVVSHRYTEPALGDAEGYLVEVLKRLRGRFERIDLAVADVGAIANEHHFAGLFSEGRGAAARLGELFDRAFYFPVDVKTPADLIERSRRLERLWKRDEFSLYEPFARHLAKAGALRLFCGFYEPVTEGGETRRWTAPIFGFLLPAGTRSIRFGGIASRRKRLAATLLRLEGGGRVETAALHEQTIDPQFAVNLALPRLQRDHPHVLMCEVEELVAETDHRPFGVVLAQASALIGAEPASEAGGRIEALWESTANLNEDPELQLRSTHFEAWVDNLRALAVARSDEAGVDFAAARGPHSRALQAWLAKNGAQYDSVLVQGVPFDVLPSTVETLSALPRRPRIVTLPHFQGDDRFHHWRRYYDAFAAADATLLFSSSVAARLDLPGKLTIVPGGGVSSLEHADIDAVAKFRQVHPSPKPFFLVLGRKVGSKGYQTVLNAQAWLKRQGSAPDVLLIGRDEDGVAIDQPGVRYLGRQPREVVRGALAECLGLISMSASESFGVELCEAWLFSKPVIANRAAHSFRELVRDGENGWLVATEGELAEAMKRVVEDREWRERMGRAGFAMVLEKFTWEKVAGRVMEVVGGSL